MQTFETKLSQNESIIDVEALMPKIQEVIDGKVAQSKIAIQKGQQTKVERLFLPLHNYQYAFVYLKKNLGNFKSKNAIEFISLEINSLQVKLKEAENKNKEGEAIGIRNSIQILEAAIDLVKRFNKK